MEERIGMVGVGAMGGALLARLNLSGARAVVFDSYAPSLEAAKSLGAIVASSPAEVARGATIIDVAVRTDQDVLDCALGSEGLLAGAQRDTLVLLHSTINPRTTERVAEEARKRGVFVIDACMVGRPDVVRAGDLSFLVGGPPELVERARPHLLRMGKRVLHMGPLGSGNVAKVIKNLITGSESLILHEAARIGAAAGIPEREGLEMIRQMSSGPTTLSHWEQVFVDTAQGLSPRVGTNIHDKDLPLAAEVAQQYGVEAPITAAIAAAGLKLLKARSKS